MWKLHRYYLKELGINSGITFLVLFAVVLISLVARGIQRAAGGGLFDAAKITLFWALDAVPHLLTIAFLLATVLTFARAAQDRELTAIRAAGVPPRVPLAAAVMLGMALSVVGSLTLHYVIPEVHFRKYRIIADAVRGMFLNLKLGSDRLRVPGSDIVMTFRDRDGEAFTDCTVYCPPDLPLEFARSSIVRVERVAVGIDPQREAVLIQLRGIRDPVTGQAKGDFEFRFSSHEITDRDRRGEGDADLRSDQLLAEVLRGMHPAPHEGFYTLFRRCCFALMPVLLAPLGYCIAEWTRERGRVVALVAALLPLGVFYLGEVLGARLLLTTREPLVAWLPAVMLVLVGAPLCWRQLRR